MRNIKVLFRGFAQLTENVIVNNLNLSPRRSEIIRLNCARCLKNYTMHPQQKVAHVDAYHNHKTKIIPYPTTKLSKIKKQIKL